MKGCPLRCLWCSNSESQKPTPEIMIREKLCIGCRKCIENCSQRAITIGKGGKKKVDRAKCDVCKGMDCAKVCPSGAIQVVGKYMSIGEVMSEIKKDEIFHRNSGGGITISGGEPLLQSEFVYALLKECKANHFHTALDTCGYAQWEIMHQTLEYTDLVLYDIKHMDSATHKKLTGVDNRLILSNIEKIKMHKTRVWLRCPVIPGFNDSESGIEEIAKLARSLEVEKISLLPYIKYGEQKYQYLGRSYSFGHVSPPSKEHLDELVKVVESFGVKVTISS